MKLYGKNPVLERIKASPETIKKLYLQKRTDLSVLVREIKAQGLDFESKDKSWFARECGHLNTQGVMAIVPDFEYASFSEIMGSCLNFSTVPVFLDGITDPQNLGAVIRTLGCMGGFSIVLPEYGSAHITETVLRVANGGENYIKIAIVTNISTTLKKIKQSGVNIMGALVDSGENIHDTELVFPLCLVLGAEGKGIRPGIRESIDKEVLIPMKGASLSYNVATAAALFCYEINNKRGWENIQA